MNVFIDGENCRKGLAGILKSAGVITGSRQMTDYRLRELLVDILEDTELAVSYYASKIRLPYNYQPSAQIMGQVNVIREYTRIWVPSLERQDISYIKAGYLKVKSAKPCVKCHEVTDVLQEKGVDVRIATDLLESSYKSPGQAIVIFSSDSDLIPALEWAKRNGTRIIYVCFADFVNRAIGQVAHETVTISLEKAKKYSVDIINKPATA